MSWTFYHFMRHGGVRSLVKVSTEMRREESSKHVIFSQVQSYCQFLNHSWPTIEIFIWNARNVKWLESRTVSNKTSWIAYNNIKRFYPLQKHSLPSLLQHGKCQSPNAYISASCETSHCIYHLMPFKLYSFFRVEISDSVNILLKCFISYFSGNQNTRSKQSNI